MKSGKIDPGKFGIALKAWCRKRKIQLLEIALILEQNPNNIYNYTRGNRSGAKAAQPTLGQMVKIADVLGVSLDQLARGPFGEGLLDE